MLPASARAVPPDEVPLQGERGRAQEPDPRNLAGLLSSHRERPRRRAAERS